MIYLKHIDIIHCITSWLILFELHLTIYLLYNHKVHATLDIPSGSNQTHPEYVSWWLLHDVGVVSGLLFSCQDVWVNLCF